MNIVFLADGEEAQLIERLPDGRAIVAPILYEEYGEWIPGNQIVVDRTFDLPPVQKYADQIESLREELDDLRDEISRAHAIKNAELANIRRHEVLVNIEAVLAGQITHLVRLGSDWGVHEVISIAEINDGRESFGVEMIRLQANISSHGDVRWVNKKDDHILPCTSYEEAIGIFEARTRADYDRTWNNSDEHRAALVASLMKHGIEVSPEMLALRRKYDMARAQKNIDANLRYIAKYQEDLKKAQEQFDQAQALGVTA